MKKKTLIVVLIISLILFGVYLFAIKGQSPKQVINEIKKRLFLGNASFPLKVGVTGLEVLFFQAWLNKYYEQTLALDGIFGPKTKAAAATINRVQLSEQNYNTEIVPVMDELKAYLLEQNIEY